MNGVRVAGAQSVVPMILTFSEDGKVTGSSPDNGCKILGVWSPGSTPRLFALDVSLNSCTYPQVKSAVLGKPHRDVFGTDGSVVVGRECLTLSRAADLAIRRGGDVEAMMSLVGDVVRSHEKLSWGGFVELLRREVRRCT